MNANNFKHVVAVAVFVLLAGISVCSAENRDTHRVSGEIGWVDVQSGKLELNQDVPKGTQTTAYRISQNDTRVTDPKDEKFLNVADLRAGQNVTIEVLDGQGDSVVPKIIVEPLPVSEFQQAFGELKAIDTQAGTLVVEERVRMGQDEIRRTSDFIFDPQTIVVMKSPSSQPVELVLKPGDVVKVDYVMVEGNKQARDITLYAPTTMGTTTTTTTTTTMSQ